MADVEFVMWLQLAVELDVFPVKEADDLLSQHGQRISESFRYVDSAGLSRSFDEFQIFKSRLLDSGSFSLASFVYSNRLSPKLFDRKMLQMVLHEIGREFRDGVLTIHVTLERLEDWERCLGDDPEPDVILQSQDLRGMNLLMDRYLAFLDHAGNLRDFWEHFDPVVSGGYGVLELRRRVRAMHNWRLNLAEDGVKGRFEDLTTALIKAIAQDKELTGLGFDVTTLLERIVALCRSWSGNEMLTLNIPFDASGGRRRIRAA